MNIDYVVVSSDENDLYLDFWELTKKMWINVVGIKPILLKICDNDSFTDYGDSIVIEIKKIENINTGLQAQLSRLYVSKYFENKNILISDIDMIPLSKSYFVDQVINYNDNSIIIYSSDAYSNNTRFPMCYVLANSEKYKKIFNINNCDFKSFINNILQTHNYGWDSDEIYMTNQIINSGENVIKLNRGWINGIAKDRVDRVFWQYNIYKLKNGLYVDSHLLRPYSNYYNEINKLVGYVL